MPPIRQEPKKRDRDRRQSSPSLGNAVPSPYREIRTASRSGDCSLVYDGQAVTPSAYYLLSNDGARLSNFNCFSPQDIDSDEILEPRSKLPLPPRPARFVQDLESPDTLDWRDEPLSDVQSTYAPMLDDAAEQPCDTSSPLPGIPMPTQSPESIDAGSSVRLTARPANCYMLYRSDICARTNSLKSSLGDQHHGPSPQELWKQKPQSVGAYYKVVAKLTENVHYRLDPDYKYKPAKKEERKGAGQDGNPTRRQAPGDPREPKRRKSRPGAGGSGAQRRNPSPNSISDSFRLYDHHTSKFVKPHLAVGYSAPHPVPSTSSSPPSSYSSGSDRHGVTDRGSSMDVESPSLIATEDWTSSDTEANGSLPPFLGFGDQREQAAMPTNPYNSIDDWPTKANARPEETFVPSESVSFSNLHGVSASRHWIHATPVDAGAIPLNTLASPDHTRPNQSRTSVGATGSVTLDSQLSRQEYDTHPNAMHGYLYASPDVMLGVAPADASLDYQYSQGAAAPSFSSTSGGSAHFTDPSVFTNTAHNQRESSHVAQPELVVYRSFDASSTPMGVPAITPCQCRECDQASDPNTNSLGTLQTGNGFAQ